MFEGERCSCFFIIFFTFYLFIYLFILSSVTTEGPLTKNGQADMLFKVNKQAYGQSSFQKNTEDSDSKSERTLALVSDLPACSWEKDASVTTKGPLTKNGQPDMRFKVNKEAYGKSSFQKNTEDSDSKSERTLALVSDLPACSWEGDASVTTKGPLTKNGQPDMRLKVNKEAYGQSSFQKSTEDSHSESERTLALVSDLPACSWERDASVTTKGPLTENGQPDMRLKVNKEAYGQSSFQKNTEDSDSKSERTLALFSDLPACPWERDARKPASPAQTSRSVVTSSFCEFEGPLKKDGTPDMRFASNNQSASSMSSLSSYSSASGPIKKDSAPDMRYAANKSSYDGSSSSGYWSGGSFYSTELLASVASPGPLKSDGTPDMRYAANRSSYASPYSYGGSAYSSGLSSIDGTPDMRYAANNSCYDGPPSSGY